MGIFSIGSKEKTPEERTYNLLKIKIDNINIHIKGLKTKFNDSTKMKHIQEFNVELNKLYDNLNTFQNIFRQKNLTNSLNIIIQFQTKNPSHEIMLNEKSTEKTLTKLTSIFENFKQKIINSEKNDLK